MSDLKFMIKLIFVITMFIGTKCAGEYGQTGNSQIGANTNTNNDIDTDIYTNDLDVNSNNCYESDSTNICVTKSNCCHVTNSYGAYTYSACVDAVRRESFNEFCNNFYDINAKQGFTAQECICNGNFIFNSATYIGNTYSIIIMIFLSVLI